jgi:hypothetical protein
MTDLSYPIGQCKIEEPITDQHRKELIEDIASTPARLRAAVQGLSPAQLDTPYRPGGWTVRQVVHHLADSHLNGFIRCKLALTEQNPTTKPYDQDKWAETEEARTAPVELSLTLLESLHQRWVLLWQSLKSADFARTFHHPELGAVTLERHLCLYAWHGRHHVAHITSLRERMGWG